ncbi:MAG: SHOCT domain-containing protein [Hyphomonadaceae bacterium]|nr:SHOCT domain-containing protein [Hyphomonadaceae bacterium]
MNTTAGAGTVACPACGAANAQTAKFCGSCGAPMAAGGGAPVPPPLPPMPPPMPPQPPLNSRFGMGGGMAGAFQAQSVAPMDQRATFDHIVRTLPSCNAQPIGQQPPSTIMVEVADKKLGMTQRYRGTLTLTPQGPQQTVVQARMSVDWGSTIGMFAALAVIGVLSAMMTASNIYTMHLAGFNILIMVIALALTAWQFSSDFPRKVANKLLLDLAGGGGAAPVQGGGFQMPKMDLKVPGMGGGSNPFAQQQPQQPAQQYTPPPVAPPVAPPAAPPVAPPVAAAEPSPIEQLERLGKLRDSGILTTEEFEAKKAELLKRL